MITHYSKLEGVYVTMVYTDDEHLRAIVGQAKDFRNTKLKHYVKIYGQGITPTVYPRKEEKRPL